MPRRRTFATAIHGLRSLDADFAPASCLRSSATPAPGHGQPLTDTSYLSAPGPEARVSTSRRRSAKRKWQDAMFRVYTVHGQPLTDTSESHKSPTRKRGLATMGSGFPCSRCGLGWRRNGRMPCFACIREPGIGGSSRSCVHAKHDILSFSLGKRSLLVLRFASCEAVPGGD